MATAVSSLNDVWGGGGGDPLRQKKQQEDLKQQELKQQEQQQRQKQELRQQELKQQTQHRALLRHLSMLQQQNDMLKQELISRSSVPPLSAVVSESKEYNTDHAVIAITLFSVLLLVVIVGFTILGCKLNKVSNSLRYVMARFGMPIH